MERGSFLFVSFVHFLSLSPPSFTFVTFFHFLSRLSLSFTGFHQFKLFSLSFTVSHFLSPVNQLWQGVKFMFSGSTTTSVMTGLAACHSATICFKGQQPGIDFDLGGRLQQQPWGQIGKEMHR
jgi:hypothetical protein